MNEITIALVLPALVGMAVIFFTSCLRRSSGKAVALCECGLEPLEARIAPAALAAKLNGGVLSVTGDADTNTVNVVDITGSIEVFDGGTSIGTFSKVKNIKINVQGGGSVNVNLSNGGIPGSINATTAGVTIFTLVANSTVNGGVSFTGDSSAQTLMLDPGVVIGKSLTFNGGAGADSFSIADGGNIAGSATFVAVEDGHFNTSVNSISIGGALRFKNASTSLPVAIETIGANGLNLPGKVSYVGGSGNDSFFLRGTFGNGASYLDRSGNNSFGFADGSTLHGNLAMTGGDGNDNLGIQSGRVEGNVTLKLGNGNNTFLYGIAGSVTIGGNLSMTTGSGDDEWRTSGGGMTISGNATLNLGDGTNHIIASAIVNGSKINVNTGSGPDTVSIDGAATNAAVRMFLGSGNDILAGVLLRANASAIFNGGDGTDHFFENMLTTDPLTIIAFEDFS